ncbi:MAG TPA: DNA-binding protein WhiA [Candidatus Cottocaccamicrobium excrementipullorum]|nr:DNA-binding protein WhiA [Candidatus Cottocaccamicrobium excrementipullorum]
MSYASTVKDELSRQIPQARHCQIAEIAAIISMCGRVTISADNRYRIKIHTENVAVARKYFTLLRKTFNIVTDVSIRRNSYLKKSRTYSVVVKEHEDAVRVLMAAKLMGEDGEIGENLSLKKNMIVKQSCCRRAFIRGAFLAAGSISNPEKSYHFEITCATEEKARQLQDIIGTFGLEARIVVRKKYYVVYMKEGSQIVDILNVMEAPVALMDLENLRILKEMRGQVNRQVNCETANIHKTVSAAVKQLKDIEYIRDTIGLSKLPEGLEEVARLRLERREATLKELGEALDPPVGKSGVNHRLRKLGAIADALREKNAEGMGGSPESGSPPEVPEPSGKEEDNYD